MINAKVKILHEDYGFSLENSINDFLKTIDVRQIIKTEYSTSISVSQYSTDSLNLNEFQVRDYSAIIYYVDYEDIRDAKIENVLQIK
jgi:hypothetical protein